ncbi:NAD(P)/FAD-dependent oxidoreductase [Nesterenkonia massiliensis]|uniref:NAD(P)/FAD-dependent oxidoreductase n=1 Tax=Nesterenkonia massiliensis TaxID=1232429 RepID=UPI0003F4AD61|nr:FAD-dependent oxidoreductase [Nesterenkonia massiliensis]
MSPRIAVVGAGIAGASVAFALARRGAAVTIIDDGSPGQATAASAGIIAPWVSTATGPFYDLYAAGGAYYPVLLEQLAEAGITRTDYRRTGSLIVNRDAALLHAAEERVRARVEVAGSVAGEVQRLTNAEARQLFPALAEDVEAVLLTGGGRVDGRTLRDALLTAAGTLGAQRITSDAQLVKDGARTAVRVEDGLLDADAVVVAAGAWSAQLLEAAHAPVPVAPQRGQITHLRLEGADTSAWPTIAPLSHHYIVAFDGGRVAVGATRETGSGFDPRVTAAGQLQVLQDALGIAPGLAEATVLETRVGLRPLADHGLPVVGTLPGHADVWVASGYGPAGLTMGPLLGDILARGVLGEDVPELAPLAP